MLVLLLKPYSREKLPDGKVIILNIVFVVAVF